MVQWEVSLNRSPWNHGETPSQKKQAPDFSEARSLHGARGTSARAAISVCIVANIAAVNECRAIAGVRTSVSNDDPKEVATLRAFERPHHVPSGDRRDRYDDPYDIASDALELGIHGAPIPFG
jgi:hypothetical protein